MNTFAGDFRWCRGISQVSDREIEKAKVPTYPATYASSAHERFDGEWIYPRPLSEVWKLYMMTPLSQAWGSKMIDYSYAVSTDENGVKHKINESQWPGLAKGTQFFLDIKGDPFGLICRLGMGVEVTEIVKESLIKFEYLDFSPPFGEQWIKFESLPGGKTRVRHYTHFFGKDAIIDFAYTIFHKEAIPALHSQLMNLAQEQRGNEIKLAEESARSLF